MHQIERLEKRKSVVGARIARVSWQGDHAKRGSERQCIQPRFCKSHNYKPLFIGGLAM